MQCEVKESLTQLDSQGRLGQLREDAEITILQRPWICWVSQDCKHTYTHTPVFDSLVITDFCNVWC